MLDVNKVDVGIVIQGIGGASRYRASVMLKPGFIQTLESSPENPYIKYAITFKGEEAHTGGTPPNPAELRTDEQVVWYRKDALMGASHFLRNMLNGEIGPYAKVVKFTVPYETGFTTVPTHQTLEIAVPTSEAAEFEAYLGHVRTRKLKQLAVDVAWETSDLGSGAVNYYDPEALIHIMKCFLCRSMAKSRCQHKIANGGGVGTVRTVTVEMMKKTPYV